MRAGRGRRGQDECWLWRWCQRTRQRRLGAKQAAPWHGRRLHLCTHTLTHHTATWPLLRPSTRQLPCSSTPTPCQHAYLVGRAHEARRLEQAGRQDAAGQDVRLQRRLQHHHHSNQGGSRNGHVRARVSTQGLVSMQPRPQGISRKRPTHSAVDGGRQGRGGVVRARFAATQLGVGWGGASGGARVRAPRTSPHTGWLA